MNGEGGPVSTDSTTTTNSEAGSKVEEHSFNNWTIRCRRSHILPSKCTADCREGDLCTLCGFTRQLSIPHLPEMVFPFNMLELQHKSGCSIRFTALEALKLVSNENLTVKIACSESWKKSREGSGLVENTVGGFDWTFRTNYNGTFTDWPSREPSSTAIDMETLKKREEILLYKDLMLFEDELHDNGVSVCNVRIRVMPSGFFVLLRFFLRVDGVIISANDTRIYHDFTTDHLLMETSVREDKVADLQVPLAMMNEPDEIIPRLTLRKSICEKLSLSS